MTLEKVQPVCMKEGVDIGVYNLTSERRLPRAVKQKITRLFSYKNLFSVLKKLNRRTSLLQLTS